MMRPVPSLSQSYNVILQEEKQRCLSLVSHIVSQSAPFNAQNLFRTRLGSSMDNECIALVGHQRKHYNPGYKTRDKQYISTAQHLFPWRLDWIEDGISVNNARCMITPSKEVTRYTTIHLDTGFIIRGEDLHQQLRLTFLALTLRSFLHRLMGLLTISSTVLILHLFQASQQNSMLS